MPGNIEKKKALDIIPGVGQALSLNEGAIKTIKNKAKKIRPVREYIEGILKGNKIILSQAITLIESTLPAHQEIAGQIIDEGIKKSGNSIRIAVTGPPGAGKSSLIETLGLELINAGKKLAVLAIDPTSEISRGSILGDKTRMENLSVKSGAFIRPTLFRISSVFSITSIILSPENLPNRDVISWRNLCQFKLHGLDVTTPPHRGGRESRT